MSIASLLSVIATAIGILGLLAGSIAYLAATRGKTTISTLSDDNAALRGRVETLEKIEIDCAKRLAEQESSIRVLTGTVTQAQAVADLLSRVDLLSTKVDNHFDRVLALLDTKAAK